MIADKLVALRRRAGMSQQEVARAIGVSRQTVSNWELAQGAPALDKAAELARLFGVTIDDLACDDVEIMAARGPAVPRDVHVLRALVGRTATVELSDQLLSEATILEVGEVWLRVSCEIKRAAFGRPKVERARTVRLIDLGEVCAIVMDGPDADGEA